MTYRLKYVISLGVAITGGLLVTAGSMEIQSSFGIAAIIESGTIKLIVGIVLFVIATPVFLYIRERGDPRLNPTARELEAIQRKAKLNKL